METSIGRIFKFIASMALFVVIIWLIVVLKSIIALLLISAIIAYILDPVASNLEFRGLSRLQSVIVIFLFLGIGTAALFYWLLPSLLNELALLQEGIGGAQASELLSRLENSLHTAIPMLAGHEFNLYNQLQSILQNFTDSFFSIIVNVVSVISSAVIVPFAVFFILKDGRRLKKNLVGIIPNKYFEMFLNLFHKVDLQLGGYLRGQFLDAVIIGLLSLVALWILGIEYFVLIGIFAGLANMIPYVGPAAGMIVAGSVVLLNDGSGQEILWVIAAFAIIQLIDNILVQPFVMARSVNLHPLVIIFAIITAGQFFGIIGMLVAIPVTGILKVVSQEIYNSVRRFNII